MLSGASLVRASDHSLRRMQCESVSGADREFALGCVAFQVRIMGRWELISICAEDCRHSVAYVIMSKARTQKSSSSRGDIMNFLISPGPSARAAGALCKLHGTKVQISKTLMTISSSPCHSSVYQFCSSAASSLLTSAPNHPFPPASIPREAEP